MILLDDNFSSIVAGIEEGRLIFDNLKKSIAYTLEHLTPEVIPYLMYFLFGIPLPLTVVLVLCIDLGTDLFPAIALAYEEAESDIMLRPPRNQVTDRLVGWRLFTWAYLQMGLIQVIGVVYTYFYVFWDLGYTTSELMQIGDNWTEASYTGVNATQFGVRGSDYNTRTHDTKSAQTAVFLSIVIVQWGGLLAAKTRKLSLFQQGMRNNAINYSLIAETLLAAFLIYTPGVQAVTGAVSIPLLYWWPPLPFSLAQVVYDEIRKYFIRASPGGWVEKLTYY